MTLRREFVNAGWTDYSLLRQVRAGTLAKPRQGAYVDGPVWRSLDAAGRHEVTARAVVKQAKADVVVSHTSGLPFWDAPDWGLDLSTVHVTRTDEKSGRCEAGVRQHQGKILDGDVVTCGDLSLMHPTRLGIESSMVLGLEATVVQLSDLVHRGLTSVPLLRDRYELSMDHWPSSLNTDLALRLVDGRLESVGEARSWFMFWKQGLPAAIPQYEIKDRRGVVVARVDFAWPERGVFAEFDGRVKYTRLLKEGESITDVVLREKQREELIYRLTGWRCIRLIWVELSRPEQTALEIRRMFSPYDMTS